MNKATSADDPFGELTEGQRQTWEKALAKSERSPRCRGFMGLLRGHKFNTDSYDFRGRQNTDKCQRCGYRP